MAKNITCSRCGRNMDEDHFKFCSQSNIISNSIKSKKSGFTEYW